MTVKEECKNDFEINAEEMKLEELGYGDFFDKNRKELGYEDEEIARVVGEGKGLYKLRSEKGELLARVKGKIIHDAVGRESYPVVGDWVVVSGDDQSCLVIENILDRRTIICRSRSGGTKKNIKQLMVSNVDVAFVVGSVDRDFNLNRIERYVTIANDGGVLPIIILNKIDGISAEDLDEMKSQLLARFEGVRLITVSAKTGRGIDELREAIESGRTYCFLGSSGVGKSTLINQLMGEEIISTKEVSDSTGRGKHTTTSRDLHVLLGGGIVIDNPGIREVGLSDMSQGVDEVFSEIGDMGGKCKYRNCTHTHEPGCRVKDALKSGEVDDDKYENYLKLKKEVDNYQMTDWEKRKKDKKLGKVIKNYQKKNQKR